MTSTTLGEVLRRADPGFASGEDLDVGVVQLRMNNVSRDGSLDWSSLRRVPADGKKLDRYALQRNDIVFNSTNSPELVGKTALFSGFKEPVVYSNHFLRLRVDPDLADAGFVARWLNFQWRRRVFEDLCTRWVNQAAVRKDDLLDLRVELPSLPDQKWLAAMLQRVDRLRRIRRYALALADTILAATFIEMLGNPVSNPRGWQRARVAELGDVQTGNTPPRDDASNYGDFVEWIKSDNLSLDQVYPRRASEGLSDKGVALGRLVDPGSVLITCIAGSATSIGNVCLTDRRVAFNQQINAVTPGNGVLPLFLYGLFLAAKPLIQRSTTLAMKRMITKGKLEELLLFRPPEDVQRQFCDAAQRGERLRAHQSEAFRQADHLFRSLLHRVFTNQSLDGGRTSGPAAASLSVT